MQQCHSFLHYTASNQKLLATVCLQRRREILKHILWAHHQVMLWKAANCEGPADELRDITNFLWVFPEEIPIPVFDEGDPAPSDYT